jgi:hypothetical protein
MASLSHPARANIHRLQPLRVLLAGTDRRFIRVTAFLLNRRGYIVMTAQPAHVVNAAARHRADVVLLEGTLSRTEAARRVAEISTLAAAPAVVVVTEDTDTLWGGISTVEKWLPLGDLVAEIETVSLRRRPAAEGHKADSDFKPTIPPGPFLAAGAIAVLLFL